MTQYWQWLKKTILAIPTESSTSRKQTRYEVFPRILQRSNDERSNRREVGIPPGEKSREYRSMSCLKDTRVGMKTDHEKNSNALGIGPFCMGAGLSG